MSETPPVKVVVGDKVRVHFHPPAPVKSFVEGAISRIDETVPHGPLIVVDVTHQVILGREAPIRLGHQDYILYERWNDFPEQIEVLPTTDQEVSGELTSGPFARSEANEPGEAGIRGAENASAQLEVEVERYEPPRRSGLIAAIFKRQR
ncbi:hypothetical protein [Microvirga makkahensis]|uniref:Uncharacterized protein n=1 Tax=Microvirga makkahensis TaxID=1128670 RepID=A0A7X3MWU1_9HYPH|nr:hypothetical protein [Microvirga makkahensis]MXQ14649.1 hypothetical protein [Microvirga makkahensis]